MTNHHRMPRSTLRGHPLTTQPRQHFTALQDSPRADLRAMHDLAVRHSSCPVCLAAEDRLPSEQWDALETIPGGTGRREPSPKSRERPTFVCPDCGWPTHCSSEHHAMDRERHAPVCASLRQWTIDEHGIVWAIDVTTDVTAALYLRRPLIQFPTHPLLI